MIKYIAFLMSMVLVSPFIALLLAKYGMLSDIMRSLHISNVKEAFFNYLCIYMIFLGGSHFGISASSTNKKSIIMLVLSVVPMVLSVVCSNLYNMTLYLSLFSIICIQIVERLYSMAGIFPNWLQVCHLISSVIICLTILLFVF
jgi:hypothetical protein